MAGLLDYLFNNLEERNLDRAQIVEYIQYLDELILHGLPFEKELEYQAIKLKLMRRLHDLNREQVKFYRKNQDGPESNEEKK